MQQTEWRVKWKCSISVIVYLLLTCQASIDAMRLQKSPQNAQVPEGDNIVLECQFSSPIKKCSWVKDGAVLLVDRKKAAVMASYETGECHLNITNVRLKDDDGYYRCAVPRSSTPGVISSPAKLTVLVAPRAPTISQLDRDLVNGTTLSIEPDTSNVALRCHSDLGNPPATLRWTLGNREYDGTVQYDIDTETGLKNATARLTLATSEISSGSVLTCHQKHDAHRQLKRQTMVVLLKLGPVTEVKASVVNTSETLIMVPADTTVRLQCEADGEPPPKFHWEHRTYNSTLWKNYSEGRETWTGAQDGIFRCAARNKYNAGAAVNSTLQIYVTRQRPEKEWQDTNIRRLQVANTFDNMHPATETSPTSTNGNDSLDQAATTTAPVVVVNVTEVQQISTGKMVAYICSGASALFFLFATTTACLYVFCIRRRRKTSRSESQERSAEEATALTDSSKPNHPPETVVYTQLEHRESSNT